jgi:hypothetical protein
MWYLGTGSGAKLDESEKALLEELALCLARAGWSLRSGARGDVDDALIYGAGLCQPQPYEVYLPLRRYRHYHADGQCFKDYNGLPADVRRRAARMAEVYQGGRPLVSPLHKGLLGSQACMALGGELSSPVRFAITWARLSEREAPEEACYHTQEAGLFYLLDDRKIPVFNMAIAEHRERVEAFVATRQRA